MPSRTLALILLFVILAAAFTVWLIFSLSGGQVPLVGIAVAVGAAFVVRLALRFYAP